MHFLYIRYVFYIFEYVAHEFYSVYIVRKDLIIFTEYTIQRGSLLIKIDTSASNSLMVCVFSNKTKSRTVYLHFQFNESFIASMFIKQLLIISVYILRILHQRNNKAVR